MWTRILAALAALLVATPIWARNELPFEETEVRERCDHYDPLKQPFFGELHLHTSYSVDAANLDTRLTPADSYLFAKGERVGIPPWQDTRFCPGCDSGDPSTASEVTPHPYCMPGERCQYTATRTIQKGPGRALDFAAITDHAEQFGETNICYFEPTEICDDDGDCSLPGQTCNGDMPKLGGAGSCVPQGYTSETCVRAREELSRLRTGPIANAFALLNNSIRNPVRYAEICRPLEEDSPPYVFEGKNCELNAKRVWDQVQLDAENAYDRSSACTFTSFNAYEYTAMANSSRCSSSGRKQTSSNLPCWANVDCPGGETCESVATLLGGFDNLHRNIIFRNADTVELPISNIEQPTGCGEGTRCLPQNQGVVGSPTHMLEELARRCGPQSPLNPGCEFLSIPHNSNISGGSMFVPETLNSNEAEVRGRYEPLVEITQIKGQSECRFTAATGIWWGIGSEEPDELCDWENMNFSRLAGNYLPDGEANRDTIPPRSFVRNTLQSGIQWQANTGDPNPFKLGFVGALDNHSGTPGQTNEAEYARIGAHGVNSFTVAGQALDETFFLGYETNPGGLTVAWAEENSRDSVFHALKNRETYATSGTRPIVRFFGGFGLSDRACMRGNLVRQGYRKGVPMGGTLSSSDVRKRKSSPTFALSALWDAGWPGRPGTKLQRIQIIKGWVDESGQTHEKVIDYDDFQKGNAGDDALFPADTTTCEPSTGGHTNLCAVWTDPDFDPEEHAFYYARVLEQPSCRWSRFYCNAIGLDCSQPMGTCRAAHTSDPGEGASCMTLDDCHEGTVCQLPENYTVWEYQQCCSDLVPEVQQERAWTSPIWYTP